MQSTRYCPLATASEARDHLGVSERTLVRWRSSGLFQAGQHWRRKFPSANSPVQYHLEQCQAVMSEATARSAHLLEPSVVIAKRPQKMHRSKPVRLRIG
jgi:hypothetical protein